jgi:RNA recognition motif-containing protein
LREKEDMETKIYIGNLSYDTTEAELRALFGEAGTVEAVDIIKDRAIGRPKGFGFITMSNQAEAENAIKMFNEKDVDGRPLTVNIARPREERSSGGFQDGSTHRRRGGSNRY